MDKDYEMLMDELTRLNIKKQAIMKSIYGIEAKLDKIKEEKAAILYKEIMDKMAELENLGYHFEVQIWNNEYDTYDWYDTTVGNHNFRYRHKDTVIVD